MTETSGALRISVRFPHGLYSGSVLGRPESLPSPARLHEAFLAAAAGGPWGSVDDRQLIAIQAHRDALKWLERNEPIAVKAPAVQAQDPKPQRYRWRATPVNPDQTEFEPLSAIAGAVEFYWPKAPAEIEQALSQIAAEVTHVGRADSLALIQIQATEEPRPAAGVLTPRRGRGAGRAMPIPHPGRLEALESAHLSATRPKGHSTGSLGKQAKDHQATGANEAALAQRLFGPALGSPEWPFEEVWALKFSDSLAAGRFLVRPENRVTLAVGVHRALVSALDPDVPGFVSGRDGGGPAQGAGHLAIHVTDRDRSGHPELLLGIPPGVPAADLARLADALARGIRAGARTGRHRRRWLTLESPDHLPVIPFWTSSTTRLRTEVPMVLEAVGGPRGGNWTIEDSVVCSVAYAFRQRLEADGLEWRKGWKFREHVVRLLTDRYGVEVRARRHNGPASRFAHRVPDHALVVAVDAVVELGDLAPLPGGFVALGRARHLGGGLLRPIGL